MLYSRWWVYETVYLKKMVRPYTLNRYLKNIAQQKKPLFIHINKTAGSSIAQGLGITEAHYTVKEYEYLYFKKFGSQLPEQTAIWASIRNPYDRVCSQYYYRRKHNQNNLRSQLISIDEWIHKAYLEKDPFYRDRELMFMPQTHWLKTDNQYPVNFIRFENLEQDYKKLQLQYHAAPLPWKKKSETVDYRTVLSISSKAIITQVFQEDLNIFNYDF
ncbi:hypothetical protein [Marixanthomonas spongiae]|uniref:Sulfotransferase family protein n=1 Tax=Marixanthomonas spongiae TaxID=2174845 RepID=A0A2U0I3T0_9FLAO|nr:hypothetical protein [Marixanthomonas spongiae]PVW15763.1 hypothetical protein DDV96_05705 [Marixanthomonas spongiae]